MYRIVVPQISQRCLYLIVLVFSFLTLLKFIPQFPHRKRCALTKNAFISPHTQQVYIQNQKNNPLVKAWLYFTPPPLWCIHVRVDLCFDVNRAENLVEVALRNCEVWGTTSGSEIHNTTPGNLLQPIILMLLV